jgi:hypothetical protein
MYTTSSSNTSGRKPLIVISITIELWSVADVRCRNAGRSAMLKRRLRIVGVDERLAAIPAIRHRSVLWSALLLLVSCRVVSSDGVLLGIACVEVDSDDDNDENEGELALLDTTDADVVAGPINDGVGDASVVVVVVVAVVVVVVGMMVAVIDRLC